MTRPVIGAHTFGYNEYSFAMSAIGNVAEIHAPQVMLDADAKLFACVIPVGDWTRDRSRGPPCTASVGRAG